MRRHETRRERALREAAEWLVLLDRASSESAAGESVLARLRQWLDDDPLHREAYGRVRALWRDAGEVGRQLYRDPLQAAALESASEGPPGERRWRRGAAFLVAAAALVLALGLRAVLPKAVSFHTRTGEQREISLADGSRVHLNAESRIDVLMSAENRRIRLPEGEALFSVAKDSSRVFVVETPQGNLEAIGTEFDVRVRGRVVEVLVVEGRVRARPLENLGSERSWTDLGAGEHLRLGSVSEDARLLGENEIERLLSWRVGILEFDDVPLAEVIRDLDPYVPGNLVLATEELGSLRVGGLLHLDPGHDPVGSLARTLPIEVIRSGDDLVLRRRE